MITAGEEEGSGLCGHESVGRISASRLVARVCKLSSAGEVSVLHIQGWLGVETEIGK
jgi:hypothetical protein